ncbi:SNX20, partial [Ictidomys tridecemlineatus]|uniref:Sorting nexin 20 n=1 Tax=Ictidomys tridecemlineatus TaxID=43179 RepID=A0A287CZN8_ICTTR
MPHLLPRAPPLAAGGHLQGSSLERLPRQTFPQVETQDTRYRQELTPGTNQDDAAEADEEELATVCLEQRRPIALKALKLAASGHPKVPLTSHLPKPLPLKCTALVQIPKEAVLAGAHPSPSSNSSMTTRELQEYWKNEKCRWKHVKLLFEIASARIEEGKVSKFVMYQIVVIQTGSFDSNKAVLDRRYSDFERLHKNLLKTFREEMEDVVLPRKRLTGNFSEEMICERKLALKEYLGLLYALRCVRRSREFADFLTRPELREAFGCLRAGQYARALDLLVRVVPLQEKLTAHCPTAAVPALCAMLVCHRDLERPAEAF